MRIPRRELVAPDQHVHLMQRGNNRRRLFSYWSDYTELARLATRSSIEHGCPIHALCLMANHLHMLVYAPTPDALSAFVKGYAQVYAQRRNSRRDGSGKLFEQRFKSPPIKSEAQFVATLLYIERNPVDAGIKQHPADYPWSTHRLHLGRADSKLPPRLWTPSAWYRALGATSTERVRRFAEAYASYDESKLTEAQRKAIAEIEEASLPYTRRLERPDRSRANENRATYGGRDYTP